MASRLGRHTVVSQTNDNLLELERALSELPQAYPLRELCPFVQVSKSQKPHHTWLYFNMKVNPQGQIKASPLSTNTSANVMSHTSQLGDYVWQVLLMTSGPAPAPLKWNGQWHKSSCLDPSFPGLPRYMFIHAESLSHLQGVYEWYEYCTGDCCPKIWDVK